MGKAINAPVGAGGDNFYPDVMTVQYLLNSLDGDGPAIPCTCGSEKCRGSLNKP